MPSCFVTIAMLQTPAGFIPLLSAASGEVAHHFVFCREGLLLRQDDLALPLPAQLAAAGFTPQAAHPLGQWEGRYCETAWIEHAEPPAGLAWFSLRSLFGNVDDGFVGLAGRAYQIAEWARTHRFCGACATPMAHAPGERAFKCPACGHTAYPRISPAMMVLIRKGDSVLLAVHAQSPYKRFTALAGFLEAGESIEEAIHREVEEEVGLKVHKLKYFASQSWPFPHSLMIAFTAEYLSGEIRVDPEEIAEARWFGPDDEWPQIPPGVSIASELIRAHRPAGR
jgi:NAD+ diphosphatase